MVLHKQPFNEFVTLGAVCDRQTSPERQARVEARKQSRVPKAARLGSLGLRCLSLFR